jgi:hypothetical protein
MSKTVQFDRVLTVKGNIQKKQGSNLGQHQDKPASKATLLDASVC